MESYQPSSVTDAAPLPSSDSWGAGASDGAGAGSGEVESREGDSGRVDCTGADGSSGALEWPDAGPPQEDRPRTNTRARKRVARRFMIIITFTALKDKKLSLFYNMVFQMSSCSWAAYQRCTNSATAWVRSFSSQSLVFTVMW